MKPYPNEELDRMSKREIIRLYKRTVEQFNDAAPVIRCKDCKWFDTEDISGTVEPIGYRCKLVARLWREPDDYCKRAERKEE